MSLRAWLEGNGIDPTVDHDLLAGVWQLERAGTLSFEGNAFDWRRDPTDTSSEAASGTFILLRGAATGTDFTATLGDGTPIYSLILHYQRTVTSQVATAEDQWVFFLVTVADDHKSMTIIDPSTGAATPGTRQDQ